MKAKIPSNAEEIRRELEIVAVWLERTPRLVHLLRYLGETAFAGQADQLTEYNIATEVFGRNKSTFVASEDAIARVETHRLRKKLKTYYEGEGKDHPIQITLPYGSYTLVFHHSADALETQSAGEAEPDSMLSERELIEAEEAADAEQTPNNLPAASLPAESPRPRKWQLQLGTGFLIALLGVGGYAAYHWQLQRMAAHNHAPDASVAATAGADNGYPQNRVKLPLRLIMGYSGPPQRDSAGDVWLPDQFFHGGWSVPQPSVYIAGTSDPFLFRYGRMGEYDYNIPLPAGTYELHMYAVALSPTLVQEDDLNKAVFDLTINGKVALSNFDPVSDAMGINIADERVLRDISPASDGILHLHISTQIGTPAFSALEILPGLPHKQLPIRIVMQNAPWTDHLGQLWHPDTYYVGGRRLSHTIPDAWATDAGLYTTEHYGHFRYAIPVDPRGRYTVILHFAELFFGVSDAAGSAVGSRIFRVLCNGNVLLDDFDIAREVGSAHPLTKTFHHLKPTAQGKLDLIFEPILNYATVSAIEVLDESD